MGVVGRFKPEVEKLLLGEEFRSVIKTVINGLSKTESDSASLPMSIVAMEALGNSIRSAPEKTDYDFE